MTSKVRRIPWKFVALAVAGGIGLAFAMMLPVADWSDVIMERIARLDLVTGLLIFAAIHFAATLLLAPAWIFPIAAGALFGFAWGLAVSVSAAAASSIVAFLVARYVLRDRVRRFAGRYSAFAAVEQSMAKEGWKMVALLRLSPLLPFGVKNYLLGTTRVALRDYAYGSLAGILPGMMLKVYVGWAGRFAFDSDDGPLKWALVAAGLAATAAATYLVGRRAKAHLKLA